MISFLIGLFLTLACLALLYAVMLWIYPSKPTTAGTGEKEPVTILIPVYNEERCIVSKLENVAALEYPSDRKRIWIVDGGSGDRTVELADAFKAAHPEHRIEVMNAPERGKIPQLNHALSRVEESQIVVISDADSLVETRDALVRGAAHLEDPSVAVVGGYTELCGKGALAWELLFWRIQNWLRLREARVHSSNFVLAPFYMFRRRLFDLLPSRCAADDVHVSFQAHLARGRVIYDESIKVTERRYAASLRESIIQKARKLQAFSNELLGLAAGFGSLHPIVAVGYLVRALLLVVWPFAFLTGTFILLEGDRAAVSVVILIALTRLSMELFRDRERSAPFLAGACDLLIILSLVLTWNLLSYPFRNVHSRYERMSGFTDREP